MDVDSFISEKDNDSVFLNKKTKRNNPKTRKKHKLSLKNFLKQKFPLQYIDYYNKLKKTENFRKSCFYAPMIYLKSYLKEKYQLNFDSLNYENVLYESVQYMIIPKNIKIYQLLLMEDKLKQKMIDLSKETTITNEEEKLKLFFLMTRTYEEFYNMYIHDSFYFSIKGKKKKLSLMILLHLKKRWTKKLRI